MFSKCVLAFCILTIVALSRSSEANTCLWSECYGSNANKALTDKCLSVRHFGCVKLSGSVPACLNDPEKKGYGCVHIT